MTYKETILKNQDINWKQPTIKLVEDGRMDLIFYLTEVLDLQAKMSFFAGIKAMTDFAEKYASAHPGDSTASQDFAEAFKQQIKDWGE